MHLIDRYCWPILTLLTPPCLEWKTQLGDRRWQDQFRENALSSATKNAMALTQVAAVLVLRSGTPKMGVEEVKKWVSDKLPSYQAPREVR